MTPSNKTRMRCLALTSKKLYRNLFGCAGLLFMLIGAAIAIIKWNAPMAVHGTRTINGIMTETVHYIPGWGIGLYIIGFGLLFLLIGFLFVPWVMKLIQKGEKTYHVSTLITPVDELMEAALAINDNPESKIQVEVNGNWIDFGVNWKNCFALSNGILRDKAVYKKLILIQFDDTYRELDYEATADINLGLGTLSMRKSVKCGRMSHKVIEYNFGNDLSTGNIGANRYSLNTAEISNAAHKWLADHGYRPA